MINQIELVTDVMRVLEKHGQKNASPRQMNQIIASCDDIIRAFETNDVMAEPAMGLAAWLASDDTGMSSLCMAHVLCKVDVSPHCQYAYPLDPADFGRCYRFLDAVPGTRERIGEMAERGPVWAAYVERWDELEALYEEERSQDRAPKLYELMASLQDRARDGEGGAE